MTIAEMKRRGMARVGPGYWASKASGRPISTPGGGTASPARTVATASRAAVQPGPGPAARAGTAAGLLIAGAAHPAGTVAGVGPGLQGTPTGRGPAALQHSKPAGASGGRAGMVGRAAHLYRMPVEDER